MEATEQESKLKNADNHDDPLICTEDEEPSEFNEDRLEEIDDNLICSICLDLLFNPVCTQWGHSFCKEWLTEGLAKWPLWSEPCSFANLKVNVTLRGIIENQFPLWTRKRKYQHEKRQRELKRKIEVEDGNDLPTFFINNIAIANFNFQGLFELRFQQMVNLVIQRNRKFIVLQSSADRVGFLFTIKNLAENWTAELTSRFIVDHCYTSQNRQDMYPEARETMWFSKGRLIETNIPEFEEEKEKDVYLQELKTKAERVLKLVFDNLELRKTKISPQVLNWIRSRYRFWTPENWNNIEEFVTKVGLTSMFFYFYEDSYSNEHVEFIRDAQPKEIIEYCLSRLEGIPYNQQLFWFEIQVRFSNGCRGLLVLMFFIAALWFFKYLQNINRYRPY